MPRNLSSPRDPELFGRLVAALRVHAGQREAQNDTERAIEAELTAQQVSQRHARQMVRTLDRQPAAARKRLGEVAERDYVPAYEPVVIPPPSDIDFGRGRLAGGIRVEVPDIEEEVSVGGDPVGTLVLTIQYNGLLCEAETTWDGGTNSDEIYVVTSTVHFDAGGVNLVGDAERHPLDRSHYTGVDDGEARVGPVAAVWNGDAVTVSVTSVVFEHDYGDPDAIRDKVDALVKTAIVVAVYFYPPAAVLGLIDDYIAEGINWLLGTGDDLIDTQTVVLPRAKLLEYATQLPLPYPVTGRSTGLVHHFTTTHKGDGAVYTLCFEVLSDPELPRGNGPIL